MRLMDPHCPVTGRSCRKAFGPTSYKGRTGITSDNPDVFKGPSEAESSRIPESRFPEPRPHSRPVRRDGVRWPSSASPPEGWCLGPVARMG